jgi:hypothetical protein
MTKTKVIKNETGEKLNKNRLITERDAAAYIGISYESLKRSIRWNRRIPYYKVNKRVSYRVTDLDTFLEQCRVSAEN